MGLAFWKRAQALDDLLWRAKAGDKTARNDFISAMMPAILRLASQISGRYLNEGQDEEISIALMAFNEAIDHYDQDKGDRFLSFAQTVIRRRLIDYFRQEVRKRATPLSALEEEDDESATYNPVENQEAVQRYQAQITVGERSLEIEELRQALEQVGVAWGDLIKLAPRHADARQNARAVAKLICADPDLLQYVKAKASLPLKELESLVSLSRKTLERQRKYILSLVILLSGDYPHLQEYLKEGGATDA